MKKILIIEDDEKLRKELEIFLNNNGYIAVGTNKFENILEIIQEEKANLILLDINLPKIDGMYILKEIRKILNTPVIMITSRNTEIDELMSMNYGADNYVTKPFNTQILLAKIIAILKRTDNYIDNEKIECEGYVINISKSRVEKDDKYIDLTANELKILTFLSKRKGKIVSREDIMGFLWDSENFIDDNTLTVNMTRLRNKLETINLGDIIETKRGQGYILN